LAPERIEHETLRRSTLPSLKPIPLGKPKWVKNHHKLKTRLTQQVKRSKTKFIARPFKINKK